MHRKFIAAELVEAHIVGSLASYQAKRAEAKLRPYRRRNLRDLVGAAQVPSIREVFASR